MNSELITTAGPILAALMIVMAFVGYALKFLSGPKLILMLLACVAMFMAAGMLRSVDAEAEWDAFKAAHKCVVTERTEGRPATWIFGESIPARTAYRCDDGVTYWKNH